MPRRAATQRDAAAWAVRFVAAPRKGNHPVVAAAPRGPSQGAGVALEILAGPDPLARPKPRACLRNRPAAVGKASPSAGLRVYGCGQRSEDVQLRWPAAVRSRPGLAPPPQRTTSKPRLSLRRNVLREREGVALSRPAGKALAGAWFALRGPFPARLVTTAPEKYWGSLRHLRLFTRCFIIAPLHLEIECAGCFTKS